MAGARTLRAAQTWDAALLLPPRARITLSRGRNVRGDIVRTAQRTSDGAVPEALGYRIVIRGTRDAAA